MRKRALMPVGASLGLVLLLALQGAGAAAPTFITKLVSPQELSAEPSIAIDETNTASRGNIYITGPGATALFVSTDGGSTFHEGAVVDNYGDADIAIDPDGNVFVSGLLDPDQTLATTIPVQKLAPGGETILRSRLLNPASTGIDCDRQWTAVSGVDHVVTSARCGSINQVWRSTDGWATVGGPFTIDTSVNVAGPLVYAPNGDLYTSYEKSNGIYYARSTDEGQTWTKGRITTDTGSTHFDVLDIDDAGNLYLVYSLIASNADESGGGMMSFFARSSNQGATWTTPVPLSNQAASPIVGNTPSAMFPWVTAGAAGKVAVSWFEASDPVGSETDLTPDLGLPTTRWDIVVATTDNALAALPVWTLTKPVIGFHQGSICTFGLLCAGPQNLGLGNVPTPLDRRALDFFETAISADGSLHIAYPQDRALTAGSIGDLLFSWMDFKLAIQTGGTKLR